MEPRSEEAKALGKRVQKCRKDGDLTQKQLAKEVGISEVYVGMIERGEKVAGKVTLRSLARVFGVRYQWLCGEGPFADDPALLPEPVAHDIAAGAARRAVARFEEQMTQAEMSEAVRLVAETQPELARKLSDTLLDCMAGSARTSSAILVGQFLLLQVPL